MAQLIARNFGQLPGVNVGTVYPTRLALLQAQLHCELYKKIDHGPLGAYSICLTGDLEMDEDMGVICTYTEHGILGRSLGYTPGTQTAISTALRANMRLDNPIRVIRSHNLKSLYAPATGFRYDGVYLVKDFMWMETIPNRGYDKFLLVRVENQQDPSW